MVSRSSDRPAAVIRESFSLAQWKQDIMNNFKAADFTLPTTGECATFNNDSVSRVLELPSATEIKEGVFDCKPGLRIQNRYELKEIIGHGNFSVVSRARDLKQELEVALKFINNTPDATPMGESEIAVLKKCDGSRFIINLLDEFRIDEHLCLVLPLMERNLYEFITSCECKIPVSFSNTKIITFQVLSAIDYLADKNIIHTDIKPENILVKNCSFSHINEFGRPVRSLNNPEILLADLNTIQEGRRDRSDLCQTMTYRAPEVILGIECDHKIDVFSVGLMMYEFITCQTMVVDIGDYEDNDIEERTNHLCHLEAAVGTIPEELMRKSSLIKMDAYLNAHKNISELQKSIHISALLRDKGCPKNQTVTDFKNALASLLELDPKHRCTAREALEQRFFIDCSLRETVDVNGPPVNKRSRME